MSKNLKLFSLFIILLVVVVFAVVSCGQAGGTTTTAQGYKTKPSGPIKIGFSQVTMNHPYRLANVDTFKKAVEQFPDVEGIVTDAEGNVVKEIANVENLIAQGCDGIIITSLSGTAIYPAYKEVVKAKIPLVIVFSGQPDDPTIPYDCFVSTDEVQMGARAADYIFNKMEGEGNLVIIDGVPESTNSQNRTKGFMPQLQFWPNIKVVAQQTGQWNRLPAMELTANILQAQPDIKCIYAQNDEMALGAMQAVIDAGRDKEGIFIVGMDSQKEALEAIINGDLFDMTIKNEWNTTKAVEVMIDAIRGKPIPKTVITDVPTLNDFNVKDYYDPESIF